MTNTFNKIFKAVKGNSEDEIKKTISEHSDVIINQFAANNLSIALARDIIETVSRKLDIITYRINIGEVLKKNNLP